MRRKNKNEPNLQEGGITLISLIVCIVIVIILAAALINVSLDNVKIVDVASNSSALYTIEQYQGIIEEGLQKEIIEEAILRRKCNTRRNKKWTKRDRRNRDSRGNNRRRHRQCRRCHSNNRRRILV